MASMETLFPVDLVTFTRLNEAMTTFGRVKTFWSNKRLNFRFFNRIMIRHNENWNDNNSTLLTIFNNFSISRVQNRAVKRKVKPCFKNECSLENDNYNFLMK